MVVLSLHEDNFFWIPFSLFPRVTQCICHKIGLCKSRFVCLFAMDFCVSHSIDLILVPEGNSVRWTCLIYWYLGCSKFLAILHREFGLAYWQFFKGSRHSFPTTFLLQDFGFLLWQPFHWNLGPFSDNSSLEIWASFVIPSIAISAHPFDNFLSEFGPLSDYYSIGI